MIPSSRISVNRTTREIVKEISRQISKTTTTTNSDAISRQDNKLKLDLGNEETHIGANKWHKLSRVNNIRALSTIQTKVKPTLTPLFTKEESREFMAVFPDIVRDLTDAGRHTDIPEVTKRFVKVLQYNVPTGKKIRGLSTVVAYKMLEKPKNLTTENIRLANILGWCVELLQAALLTMDDVMDHSEKRRGQLAWYRNEGVGLLAINDAFLMENGTYSILRKYFSTLDCYVPIMEIFHDITFKSSMGQMLDGMCLKSDGRPDLDKFTMKRYSAIVKYKTAYYTFQLPIASAMYLAKMFDPEQHRQAKTILCEMGEFFQVADDFLDCFGDPEAMGKIGTDIQDGKCSWLAVVALQRATSAQRKIMEQYYGRNDPESIQIIRNLYEELHLPATYAVYEEESFNIIRTHIQQISKGLPHDLFFKIMKTVYKRDV